MCIKNYSWWNCMIYLSVCVIKQCFIVLISNVFSIFQSVFNGMHVIFIPYSLMKVDPASWMKMITKYKGKGFMSYNHIISLEFFHLFLKSWWSCSEIFDIWLWFVIILWLYQILYFSLLCHCEIQRHALGAVSSERSQRCQL